MNASVGFTLVYSDGEGEGAVVFNNEELGMKFVPLFSTLEEALKFRDSLDDVCTDGMSARCVTLHPKGD